MLYETVCIIYSWICNFSFWSPVFRLEEKENEMRKEFTKVHDRYTELLKVHMDHVERTRGLLGADRLEGAGLVSRQGGMNSWNLNVNLTPPQLARSTGPLSFGFASLENASGQVVNSKFFSNPVAEIGNVSSPTVSHPPAIQTELLVFPILNDIELTPYTTHLSSWK